MEAIRIVIIVKIDFSCVPDFLIKRSGEFIIALESIESVLDFYWNNWIDPDYLIQSDPSNRIDPDKRSGRSDDPDSDPLRFDCLPTTRMVTEHKSTGQS